ncbi:MAG: Flp family type IVb pilin [Beijerinckiaceae bacterium]
MKRFWADESAVTPAEYALLAAFVSLVTAGFLALAGKNVAGLFDRISTQVGGAGPGGETSKQGF